MNLKTLAGKFPNDDRLITSMAVTMAVRKLIKVKATNAFEANIIYLSHFQVDLPCHGIPSTFFNVGGQRGQEDYEHIICLEAKCTS